jgi:transcriptional regulator with XRE-family HTH domain
MSGMPDTAMPLDMRVNLNVRQLLREKGVTQAEIGHHLRLSQTQVWERCNGRISWTLRELDEVAAALDVDVDDLFLEASAIEPSLNGSRARRRGPANVVGEER